MPTPNAVEHPARSLPFAHIHLCWTATTLIWIMALLQNRRRSGMEGVSEEDSALSDVKGRPFEGEIVLWAVRWYCRYGISYRDLEQMMAERGVSLDHFDYLQMGPDVTRPRP